ncbi:tetratricopeptide repeat protein [Streptomyces sp. NBC_01142]|uniref:tetratricopeptide repeat protein n=1 Tax=Streptomyces sp. NBC_01142 TaxID=2975865 RepID=UPI0022582234|nr:tetratricopeptide repeat protein [Streptomyces sp. NBC_01142]MCX4825047.1 tetratricopeptide repeat protein [Streptomyces sp. NBC_01142]
MHLNRTEETVGHTVPRTPADAPEHDVFLCHNWADKTWAIELYEALDALGVRVFRDDVSMDDWDEMSPSIRDALLSSLTLVPLITPDFPDSPHCRQELHLALTCAYRLGEGATGRVTAVTAKVRPSAVRPRQLGHNRLPKEGKSTKELAARIAQRVAAQKAADPRPFGAAPQTGLPDWFPDHLTGAGAFRGRYDELWELHEGLLARSKARDRGHPVVSVRGMGGQGKTALCEQYARLFAEDHPGGVFVVRLTGSDRRVRSDPTAVWSQYLEQLALIGERLEITDAERSPGALIGAIGSRLRRRPPYLWIVDDVPSGVDPELLTGLHAPTGNGKTLITTRGRLGKRVSEELELCGLDPRAGLAVLTVERVPQQGNRPDEAAAKAVVQLLGGLPLALTLAAGLTTRDSFEGYEQLLAELRGSEPDALELASHLEDELPTGYALPFTAALLRSYASLTDTGREVLCAAGVLAPAPIPLGLLADVLGADGTDGTDGAAVERGARHAAHRGMADLLPGDGQPLLSVHALTSRAVRFVATDGYRLRLRNAAVRALTDALTRSGESAAQAAGTSLHHGVLRYLPHVRSVAALTPELDAWPVGPEEWHLVNEAGRVQTELGDSAGTLRSRTELYASCAASPHCDEATRLTVLLGLGDAHFGQGDHTTARRLQEDALRGMQGVLGPDHHNTLTAAGNLANTLSALRDHDGARELLTAVYRARRDAPRWGLPHRETLLALNNLVIAVGRCGHDAAGRHRARRTALRYAHAAHALWRRAAGPRALATLDALENVATNLRALGRHEEAGRCYAEVWEGRRRVLGDGHPDTIDAQENMITTELEHAGDTRFP